MISSASSPDTCLLVLDASFPLSKFKRSFFEMTNMAKATDQETNYRAMANEKSSLTDQDAVDLAGAGKRQQLGVSSSKTAFRKLFDR
jgi:hypothetical protein